MHPLAIRGNQSGANGMCAGDRVRHIDGRTGIADEFLHDGDALITWDDGTFGEVKWKNLTKGLEGMTTTPNPTADEARLRDHETIWLGPNCEDRGEDRCWAPDNPWGDGCDECGEKPVKFVRADLYAAALARAEAAEKELETHRESSVD